jgi:hypothetical protein
MFICVIQDFLVGTPERSGLLESHRYKYRYRLQKHIKTDFHARNGRAKTVLKCGSEDGQVSVSCCQCCNVGQEMDKCRCLASAVMNIWV